MTDTTFEAYQLALIEENDPEELARMRVQIRDDDSIPVARRILLVAIAANRERARRLSDLEAGAT